MGAEVSVDGESISVSARVVVNAAGPWVDHVRRLEDPRLGTSVRLSKGVHVVVSRGDAWSAALTVPQDDIRVTFAVPWYDLLLLGTTDTEYAGDPGAATAEAEEVEEILAEASVALSSETVARERVRASYAGLRVLPAGDGESVSARRETVFSESPGGMLNVAGGKLTTYRRIALAALDRLRPSLGLGTLDRRPWPLPGAVGLDQVRPHRDLEPETWAHLLRLYGSMAPDVLAPALEDTSLLERLHPAGPDIAAQARYAVTHEWARNVDDVLRRRTTCFYRGLTDDTARQSVERAIGGRLAV